MADTNRIENVQIHSVERTRNSASGNPGWRFFTSTGTFLLSPDASLGYGVENYTNTRRSDTYCIGDDAPPVTLLVDARTRRVCYIEKDGEVLR